MTISLTNENKNSVALSMEDKGFDLTWDQANFTWDEGLGTWGVPGTGLSMESKNNISLTNENKS